jgi:hypothetical protein
MFQQYRQTAMDNLRGVRGMTVDSYVNKPLEDLKDLFNKYASQKKSFQAIPTSQDVGILRVDSRALKAAVVPSPDACLSALGALLPRIASHLNDTLLVEVSDALRVSVVSIARLLLVV